MSLIKVITGVKGLRQRVSIARALLVNPSVLLFDAKEDEPYSYAKEIARKALNRQLKDPTDGAMYFHNRKVTPSWSKEYVKTFETGEHVFYKSAGGKAK